MYLEHCRTLEELKSEYKTLAKKLHPDCGGDTESMKVLNNEYERMFALLKDKHNATATADEQKTSERPEEFMNVIEKLIHLDGLKLEICGSWLWVSGATWQYKEQLKAAGCCWASTKKMWFWRSYQDACRRNRKTQSMDKIRARYGSERVETVRRVALA